MKEMIEIQKCLKAPKNQKNKFGGYNYRSCEDILEAVKPLLHDVGCYLVISDEIDAIEGRVYVRATATLHNSEGQSVCSTASAREAENKKGMDAAQITGAASSYARKYALNGLFCIDDTRDADATNDHGKGKKTQQKPPVDFEWLGSEKGYTWLLGHKTADEVVHKIAKSKYVDDSIASKITDLWIAAREESRTE